LLIESIKSWEGMITKFLAKYFPPSKAPKLRGDITTFVQFENESIYEAWERYKGLLKVSHIMDFRHGWRSNFSTMD